MITYWVVFTDTVTDVLPVFIYKNVTVVAESAPRNQSSKTSRNSLAIVHYLTFIAGALAITIYNRKSDIVVYTKQQILKINIEELKRNFKENVKKLGYIIVKRSTMCCIIIRQFVLKCLTRFKGTNECKPPLDGHIFNALLLKKLRSVSDERNNLAQLLYAAGQDNKNIRFQHQLETMAKNRFSRKNEDSQKQIKEYRITCQNLQQLYLVTQKENVFLKIRVQKLIQDKQDTERDFMMLFTQAYQSHDKALKSYCTRFAVLNKDNLLNSDLSKQILRFVQKYRYPSTSPSTWQASRRHNISLDDTKKLPVIEEVDVERKDQNIALIEKEPEPKLRGLPGEYVWTVKDKDGIIEKLYEYDYGCDFDNGDAIRRIREYTVYHDKDCLLDFDK